MSRKIRIAAPPAAIWAVLVDVERWPRWASQFSGLERLDAGPLALGTRVRVKPKSMPASTWTVLDYEAERRFTWVSSLAPGLRVVGGHELSLAGDSTDAEFWLQAEGPLGTLLAPILERTVFRQNTQTATAGLQRFLESPA